MHTEASTEQKMTTQKYDTYMTKITEYFKDAFIVSTHKKPIGLHIEVRLCVLQITRTDDYETTCVKTVYS